MSDGREITIDASASVKAAADATELVLAAETVEETPEAAREVVASGARRSPTSDSTRTVHGRYTSGFGRIVGEAATRSVGSGRVTGSRSSYTTWTGSAR
jgi:hypothetical protein